MVDTIRCNMVAKFGRPTQCLAPGHKSVDKLFEKKKQVSLSSAKWEILSTIST